MEKKEEKSAPDRSIADHRTFQVIDPGTGKVIGEVADMGASDAAAAIEKAQASFGQWSALLAGERASILKQWHMMVQQNARELARTMTLECGKPFTESRAEVAYGASFIEWSAEQARRTNGEIIPSDKADRKLLALLRPVGVVAAITPWNFPLAMVTRKISPALAAGCTVVLKPASATPLTALRLQELALEAGLPDGVFNIVTGTDAKAIGEVLATHPLVRKISFTGSTAVGKQLMKLASGTVKKVSLELGGNAPYIIFGDADMEEAVQGVIASKFRNSGQTCVCANRVFVQREAADLFLPLLQKEVEKLKVGHGLEEGVAIGPLIDDKGVEKVERLIADAIGKGARILCGGKRHGNNGRYFQPTIFVDITSEMDCTREEIFGPVIPVIFFDREEEAVRMANDTPYGLAAYFHTRDAARMWRVGEALEYGMVGVNTGMISTAVAPFGGVKESGIGREGSQHSLHEFMEWKYIAMAGLK